jgi:hypothetical protein
MIFRTEKRRYNTETGKILIKREDLHGPFKNSEEYYVADLYRSRGGEYFLYGLGGVLSVFRGTKKDMILPLDRETAKLICKEFARREVYQAEFEGNGQNPSHSALLIKKDAISTTSA